MPFWSLSAQPPGKRTADLIEKETEVSSEEKTDGNV